MLFTGKAESWNPQVEVQYEHGREEEKGVGVEALKLVGVSKREAEAAGAYYVTFPTRHSPYHGGDPALVPPDGCRRRHSGSGAMSSLWSQNLG